MKDRAIQGFIAGIVGWLPQLIFTQTMYWVFHLTKLQFYHFAGILAFSHKPHGFLESLFSEFIVVALMAALGILFALVIKIIGVFLSDSRLIAFSNFTRNDIQPVGRLPMGRVNRPDS